MRHANRFLGRLIVFLLATISVIVLYPRYLILNSSENINNLKNERLDNVDMALRGLEYNNKTLEYTFKPVTLINISWVADNVLICVKTTSKYHKIRLNVILKTWFLKAVKLTWFFTDEDDEETQKMSGGHMINTRCPATHSRSDLCCKMSAEFDAFINSDKRWFCHFDDDNYVNVKKLIELLQQYSPDEDWYLGRPSLAKEMVIRDVQSPGNDISFWFATGGAGFCISRSLALKMVPLAGNGKLQEVCSTTHLPDDCAIGYIISYRLNTKLTVIKTLHSHLEFLEGIPTQELSNQISFGYSKLSSGRINIIKVNGFNDSYDPTRFLSLHCLLYPEEDFCIRTIRSNQRASSPLSAM